MNISHSHHHAALIGARAAGNFAEGLAIARAAHEEYPREHARTYYWQACMLCLLGRDTEALGLLERGLAEGVWYNPGLLDTDQDLSSLRANPDFATLHAECAIRNAARQAEARAECIVVGPATAVWEQRWILALHQWGQNARDFAGPWMQLVNEGWTVAVPQSSQVHDSSTYTWKDPERARAEIRGHLEDCVERRGMDPDGLVLAGASQGALLALEIAHEMAVPWLCVIPGFPVGYDLAPLLGMPTRLKGAFLVGGEDPHTQRTLRVAAALVSAGASVGTFIMPDVGHEIPEDFISHARVALRSLSETQA